MRAKQKRVEEELLQEKQNQEEEEKRLYVIMLINILSDLVAILHGTSLFFVLFYTVDLQVNSNLLLNYRSIFFLVSDLIVTDGQQCFPLYI